MKSKASSAKTKGSPPSGFATLSTFDQGAAGPFPSNSMNPKTKAAINLSICEPEDLEVMDDQDVRDLLAEQAIDAEKEDAAGYEGSYSHRYEAQ